MKQDSGTIREALVVLSGQLAAGGQDYEGIEGEAVSLEDVRQFVAERTAYLLDRNPALLMSILYRVDVAERDVKRVLHETESAYIPLALADLLIERQLQKIWMRRSRGQ